MPEPTPPRIEFQPFGADKREDIGAGLMGPFGIRVIAWPGDRYEVALEGKPPGAPSDWADLPEYPWGPYTLEATLYWSGRLRRYQMHRLESSDSHAFHSGAPDTGITALGLRAVRVGRLHYDIARELLQQGVVALPDDGADRVTQAARAATCARAFGANSQDFAAEHLGVSRSTAKRLLASARDRGLLDG